MDFSLLINGHLVPGASSLQRHCNYQKLCQRVYAVEAWLRRKLAFRITPWPVQQLAHVTSGFFR
jgi:hypothetical protein